MLNLFLSFQDTLKVLLGAFTGILGSLIASYLQNRTHKKRYREELLLRTVLLAMHSLTYNKCIAYAKYDELKTLIQLPENPLDQLLAIVLIHFPSAFPLTKKLHDQQQDLHELPHGDPHTPDAMKELCIKMAITVTDIIRELNDIGIRENIGVNFTKPKGHAVTQS
ncbi:MAG: hypothetical protein ABSF60_11720 [Verrucomicrobiota bacterium]|jgi:hypothetical protein